MTLAEHARVSLSPLAYAREAERLRVQARREYAFAACLYGKEAEASERRAALMLSQASELAARAMRQGCKG